MLAKLARRVERGYDPSSNPTFYSLPGGFGMTQAAYTGSNGIESTLANAASWACIRVLMDALSRTPIQAVREVKGQRTPLNPQPRILVNPSGLSTVDVWKAQAAFSLLTDGNIFGRVAHADIAGRPDQIELLDATTVTERKVVDGHGTVKVNDRTELLYPFGDVWHVPGDMVMPGSPFAISPIAYARKVIGTSLAAEDFSYRFFEDGGHPPMAFQADVDLDGTQADEYKRRIMQTMRGSREPLVYGSGFNLQELHLDPSETQFIDLMRFCVEQACRFWGVPPTMIFSSIGGQHMTYSNVTQADLHFLKNSLEGKYVRLETALTDLLPGNAYSSPSVPNTLAVCDRNAVLKADIQTRFATYAIGLTQRFLAVNEVRSEEGLSPFEGEEYDKPALPPFAPTQDPQSVDENGNATPAPTTTQPADRLPSAGKGGTP